MGLFYVGDRQGDLANTFELPNYLRTDAALSAFACRIWSCSTESFTTAIT
ncbi:MAG: hypothetical protein KME46_28450 [Brasilonema angustatum HA4187-MV1]|nr:hypothetical protein [Brasilonema angustatum HA4187-MV1]